MADRERKHVRRYGRIFRRVVYIFCVAAAAVAFIVTLRLPILRIYGGSMDPVLKEGDMVVAVKGAEFAPGDLAVFDSSNKILVRRYIAGPGQWVDMDKDGNVYVDGKLLDEPYLTEKALGKVTIDMPCRIPDGKIFVLGDHRSASVDSRSAAVGCVEDEQIIGKIAFRFWPLTGFGTVNK